LADREDIIVIGVLGVKGARLDGVKVPPNTRVVDYLMYEAVLAYADVFITNGGYNGFMTGVMHGVPMVLAGRTGKYSSPISLKGQNYLPI
jgi:UDP:flavonoid glycosyltransferase YjiC (YdhE family)